jgi:hypothetical protein
MRINFGPEANIELLSVETPLCQMVLLLLSVIAHRLSLGVALELYV